MARDEKPKLPKNGSGYALAPAASTDRDSLDTALRYGWGSWTPARLQFFNTIRWYVFWTSVFSLVQGFIVNGVINAVITSLETRFDLPSTRSGLIASSNNFVALFFVLAITYYGGQKNKPKIVAMGILGVGVGSFVFSLPHFMAGVYNYKSSEVTENVCHASNSTLGADQCGVAGENGGVDKAPSHLQNYMYVFIIGNALHGIGATPVFTLGNVFIDENTRAESTSWYLGIVMAAASLGVAAGYMIGGQFLNIYTDIDRVNMHTVDITPMDPRWVGAWWIPFLISGLVMLLLVAPMAAFPSRLPGSATRLAAYPRKSEAYQLKKKSDVPVSTEYGQSWQDFPRHIALLARNPTFVFLSLSVCAEGVIVSGVAAFGAKFLQTKFNLPAAIAGFVMGMITVPGAGGGMLIGGYLVKRLKLKCRGMIRLNLVAACMAFMTGAVFLIQCPTQPSAGINVHYGSIRQLEGPPQLADTCNAGCGCTAQIYEPVCGMDGVIYFSPCHAGCDETYEWLGGTKGPYKRYQKCHCVAMSLLRQAANATNSTITTHTAVGSAFVGGLPTEGNGTEEGLGSVQSMANQGICMSDCQLLYVVGPLMFLGMLLTFTTVSPTQTATFRCVPENERALATGFQWLILRLGGTMPGPLMLGAIIDSACRVWEETCGVQGMCWVYARRDMGIRIFVWWLLVKAFSIVCYFLAQFFYRSEPGPEDPHLSASEQKEKVPLSELDLSGLASMPDRESIV